MPPLVKEYLDFQKIDYLKSVSAATPDAFLRTFLSTDSLVELLTRILETMVAKFNSSEKPGAGPVSTLLTGGYGSGKTHLLKLIHALLTVPQPFIPRVTDPRVISSVGMLRRMNPLTVWIDSADSPEVPLPELILTKIAEAFQTRHQRPLLDPANIPGIDLIRAHEIITFRLTAESPTCLIIDGLSERALHRSLPQINEDIEFLSFLGFSSKSAQLFLLVAAHEDFFSPTSPLGIDNVLMAQTLENFKIDWIDRTNLREIISRNILKKSPRQKLELSKIFSFIKLKLPNFQSSERDFADSYPFHPVIFDLAEKIRGKVPSFALIDFVINTYPRISSHRAISIVTLDHLFDQIEYDIKQVPVLEPLYSLYLSVSEKTLERQQGRWKSWGKMLLKALFLFTLADRTPTVRELADSLLLFEDTEAGLSYNTVGMLLIQMEKDAESDFTVAGDRLERAYRFRIALAREEFDRKLSNIASQIPDSDSRLAQTLLMVAEHFFPDWPVRRLPFKGSASDFYPRIVNWNGTERPGLFLLSSRFWEIRPGYQAEGTPAQDFVKQLPEIRHLLPMNESELSRETPEEEKTVPKEIELEWVFFMEPIGLDLRENIITSVKQTEIHWVPGVPSLDQVSQFKNALALHLSDQPNQSTLPSSEMQRIRDDSHLDLVNLFQDLYLSRARLVMLGQEQALNQGHAECRSFQAFLDYIFKPNFRELYPHHPDFKKHTLHDEQALILATKLFKGQVPTDPDVQKMAGQFALPLGLVSRLNHLYELNLTLTPPPFITEVVQYLEGLDTADQTVDYLYAKLRQSPYGITGPAFHLILAALVADGQIELVDPVSGNTISRENLDSLNSFTRYPCFRKILTHREFPTEVLTQWVHLITGSQEVSDISASRGRTSAINNLKAWLEHWKQLGISQNLESLPDPIITTQMWSRLAWTKRRFDQVAEILEMVFSNHLTLIQGMAKIIDLFGEQITNLEKASRNLVELSAFFDWLKQFDASRTYLLSSEKTDSPEIEEKREKLKYWVENPHELVESDTSREFEALFQNFKELYLDYYLLRHDQSIGPKGHFELLDELETTSGFRNLQLLSSLPMGDFSYLESLEEWVALVRGIRCQLPARDLLREKPYCQCGFRLSRPVALEEVATDLQHFIDMGIAHHRQVLEYFRPQIEAQLALEESGASREALTQVFRQDPFPELTQELADQVAELIGNIAVEEQVTSPLPILAPAGRITKRHLQFRIQKWLDSLSGQDDLLVSFREM